MAANLASAQRRIWSVVLPALLLAVVGYCMVRAGRQAARGLENDFGVYYRAGEAMLAGAELYRADDSPLLTFKYAPVVALACMPLSLVDPVVARIVWCLVDLGLIVACFQVALRIAGGNRLGARSQQVALGLATFFTIGHVVAQVHCGQSTSLWLLLVLLAFEGMRQGRLSSGPLLAAAVCLKCVPIALVPYYLVTKRPWSGLASFGAGLVALALLPSLWVGFSRNAEYLSAWPVHLGATETPEQLMRSQNQSILAQSCRWFASEESVSRLASSLRPIKLAWLAGSVAAAIGIYLWIARHRQVDGCVHLSVLLVFVTLANPFAWRYNFLAMVVPVMYVLVRTIGFVSEVDWIRNRHRSRLGWCLALLLLGSILNTAPLPDWVFEAGGRIWGTGCVLVAMWFAGGLQRSPEGCVVDLRVGFRRQVAFRSGDSGAWRGSS